MKRDDSLLGIMIKFVATLSIIAFAPAAEGQSRSGLGSCTVIVDGGALSVIGNEAANTIELDGSAGSDRGVRVTCDGATATFAGIHQITVKAGDGADTVSVDNSNGFLGGIGINIFAQGGDDLVQVLTVDGLLEGQEAGEEVDFDGGDGEDELRIVAGPRADAFHIAPGAEANSVAVQVTDIATKVLLANVTGSDIETLTVEAGHGHDTVSVDNSNGLLGGIGIKIFGQGGDDRCKVSESSPLLGPTSTFSLSGGEGDDRLEVNLGGFADRLSIAPGEPFSVEMKVTHRHRNARRRHQGVRTRSADSQDGRWR